MKSLGKKSGKQKRSYCCCYKDIVSIVFLKNKLIKILTFLEILWAWALQTEIKEQVKNYFEPSFLQVTPRERFDQR